MNGLVLVLFLICTLARERKSWGGKRWTLILTALWCSQWITETAAKRHWETSENHELAHYQSKEGEASSTAHLDKADNKTISKINMLKKGRKKSQQKKHSFFRSFRTRGVWSQSTTDSPQAQQQAVGVSRENRVTSERDLGAPFHRTKSFWHKEARKQRLSPAHQFGNRFKAVLKWLQIHFQLSCWPNPLLTTTLLLKAFGLA